MWLGAGRTRSRVASYTPCGFSEQPETRFWKRVSPHAVTRRSRFMRPLLAT